MYELRLQSTILRESLDLAPLHDVLSAVVVTGEVALR
jgi:hypothetical protein